jgi:hypothetical protein
MQYPHAMIVIKEAIRQSPPIVIRVTSRIIQPAQIQIILQQVFQQPAPPVILFYLAGNRQLILSMMHKCFRFIPEDIKDNGHFVQTAIQLLPITHCLIASIAIPMYIKTIIILMPNVIVAIQGEQEGKIYL